MHYEIDYSGLSDSEKSRKALADVKDYFGDRYAHVVESLQAARDEGASDRHLEIGLSFFGGVEGPPTSALIESLYSYTEGEWDYARVFNRVRDRRDSTVFACACLIEFSPLDRLPVYEKDRLIEEATGRKIKPDYSGWEIV